MSPPVAVVTGANRGIGRAIAVAFAAAGYAVLASARDPASLADTVAEAQAATAEPRGGTAVAVRPATSRTRRPWRRWPRRRRTWARSMPWSPTPA